jgi:photosystem II stability/assembly factor-like uncharacterized protein
MKTIKRYLPQLASGVLLLLPLSSACSAAMTAPAELTQNSIMSKKATAAVMLAVTSAGSRLVAVGERGIVLLSDDAGKSWRQVATPVQVSLVAVQFVDAKIGWAVGHLGVVLHTVDGGQSWSKQLDGIQAAELMARAASTPESQAAAKQMLDDGPDKPFLNLYFEDAANGYVIGAYNLIFKTADGGKSWQPWQTHVNNPKAFHLYGMHPAGDGLYLVGEQGTLFRSTDRGATFETLVSPYKGSYFGLVTASSGEIVIFGLRGSAFWSGDQGRSWDKIETKLQVALTAGIALADGSLALLSQAGDVLISRDKGRSFEKQAGTDPMPAAAFAQAGDTALIVAGLRGVKRLTAQSAVQK